MIDFPCLVYLPDPFSVRDAGFWAIFPDGSSRRLTAAEVSDHKAPLVTYDLPTLTDELRRHAFMPPSCPIDVGEALRLLVGRPRDEGGERRWDIWRHLARHFPTTAIARRFEDAVRSRTEHPEEPDFSHLLSTAAAALQRLWREVHASLLSVGELERFVTVEVPVQSIFAYRQGAGIAIDATAVNDLLRRVRDEKYGAYRQVAQAIGASPTGLNFWNIGPYIAKTDAAHLVTDKDGGRLREDFKMASHKSHFARDFLRFADASRDEDILRRTAASDGRVYPNFSVAGTVSGRIMVSDPYLQQLRRSYRGLVAADPGKRLVYLDYAQFEPGILAFLAEDQNLIRSYNDGDLYLALSQKVFRSSEMRPLSKRIFLAFCYGMSPEGIARLIAGPGDHAALLDFQSAVETFFSAFPGLATYRAKAEGALLRDGSASSLMGNRRYRAAPGALSAKERRWAVNQPVQSTAALIFKEALISLGESFDYDSILLPMHDAVLMQLSDDDKFDRNVELAKQVMLNAFSRRCPGVAARVTTGPFCS